MNSKNTLFLTGALFVLALTSQTLASNSKGTTEQATAIVKPMSFMDTAQPDRAIQLTANYLSDQGYDFRALATTYKERYE